MSMLPAATSCRSGFQRCVRLRSTSVTLACPRRPSVSPSRVASSSPPAPPPTTTMRCGLPERSADTRLVAARHGLAAEEKLRPEPAPLVPLVEGDRGIDQAVLELVERTVDGAARGHAVSLLDDFLAV